MRLWIPKVNIFILYIIVIDRVFLTKRTFELYKSNNLNVVSIMITFKQFVSLIYRVYLYYNKKNSCAYTFIIFERKIGNNRQIHGNELLKKFFNSVADDGGGGRYQIHIQQKSLVQRLWWYIIEALLCPTYLLNYFSSLIYIYLT